VARHLLLGVADAHPTVIKTELLVASSDTGFRRRVSQSLAREPDIDRIYTARNRHEIERVMRKTAPPLLLLDHPMTGVPELATLRRFRRLSPSTKMVVLSRAVDDATAVAALMQGACGYCGRATNPALLRKAVRLVLRGEIWVRRSVVRELLRQLAGRRRERTRAVQARADILTRRERQICALITDGASNKEIAKTLAISERTVKAHLTSIFHKVGVSNRLQLAIYAMQTRRSY